MKDTNKQFEAFIRDFEKIRMTDEEKNEIQNNLILFTRSYIPKPSPYLPYISFFKKAIAVSLILLLMISVSKPVSAKSLPGDFLYSVKIIHEEIESALIQEPEKKVDFEIKRTKTRIQEAVTLAKHNKLDTSKQKKLAQDIQKHIKNVSAEIEDIKKESPEKALALNSNLKTTLKVSSKVLQKVVKNTQKNEKPNKDDQITNTDINEIPKIDQKNNNSIKTEEETALIVEKESKETSGSNSGNKEIESINDAEKTKEENKRNDDFLNKDNNENDEKDTLIVENNEEENIILNSISDSIEKTEIISDTIEKEITSNEPKDINSNVSINNVASTTDTTPDTIKKDDNNNLKEVININGENTIPESEVLNSNEIDTHTNDTVHTTLSDKVSNVENTQKTQQDDVVISENIRSEIISLENVLEAEQRLKELLDELSKERKEENILLVKKLIEEKKFGQAYIEIQKEIESLTEIKLSKELGLNEVAETNTNNNNDIHLKEKQLNSSQTVIENTQH